MPDLMKGIIPLLQQSGLGRDLPKMIGAGIDKAKAPKKPPAK